MAAWMLHGGCVGEETGARHLVFFRVKWLQPAMEGSSCVTRVWAVRFGVFLLPRCNGGLKLLWMRLCVRSYRVFWNLWLLIAVEWLHDCCHVLLPCAWIDAGLPRGAAKRIVMAAWMLHGVCFGEEAGARNHVCFRVKWLQAAAEGISCVRRSRSVGFDVFPRIFVWGSCFWLGTPALPPSSSSASARLLTHNLSTHNLCTHNLLTHNLSTTCSHTQLVHTHNLFTHAKTSSHTTCSHTTCPHTHNLSTHDLLTHNLLTHNFLTHNLLTHNLLTHNLSTHDLPTHNLSTHDLFTHDLLTHTTCPWQARRLVTSTFTLRGRRGAWRHGLSLCVAGMALGDIDLHFVWQAWCLWHWAGSGGALGRRGRCGCLRGMRGTWRHRPSFCVASVALGDIDLHFAWQAWHLATLPRLFAWQAWHLATSTFTLRGRRGTWRHGPALCVAGVALMALGWLWRRAWFPVDAVVAAVVGVAGEALGNIDFHFAWQARHLVTSTFTLRGRRGAWRHGLSLCVAGVALGDIDLHFAWHA